MSYKTLKYSLARKILANCDKCSANCQSKVVRSPWGKIKMYDVVTRKNGRRTRLYSVSESDVIHNGGCYTISSLRERILTNPKVIFD